MTTEPAGGGEECDERKLIKTTPKGHQAAGPTLSHTPADWVEHAVRGTGWPPVERPVAEHSPVQDWRRSLAVWTHRSQPGKAHW